MAARRVAYLLGSTGGGTGRHVAMLASGCSGAGIDVSVLGPPQMRSLIGREAVGAAVPAAGGAAAGQRAQAPGRGRIGYDTVVIADRPRPLRDAAAVRRVRRLLAGTSPDVVHAHGLRAGAVAALAIGPVPDAPRPGRRPSFVVTVHNAPPAGPARAAVYRLLARLVARRADVVLCVSGDLAARMRDLGAREVGRAIVPAPAVTGRGTATRQAAAELVRSLASGRPAVVAAGRLARQKGFDVLLEAAARWQGRSPEPVVLLAGAGPLAGDLARQARELSVAAEFLGHRNDVPALLAAADVVVLPSRWEGQPLVLQEALAAGRPVVATDVGGVRDLAGDAALLVPAGDPEALAAAVARVLDEPDLAASLAAAAAARALTLPGEADAVAAVIAMYQCLSGARG